MNNVELPSAFVRSNLSKLSQLNLPMTVKERMLNCEYMSDTWVLKQNESSTPSDLVSLAWLQKGNILQITPLDGEDESNDLGSSSTSISSIKNDDYPSKHENNSNDASPTISSNIPIQSVTCPRKPNPIDDERINSYDVEAPHYTVNNQGLTKPNYSYTHLIFMAIESAPQKCMTVNQIYNWCETNFPFYKHAGAGWKNSLRHNLSINKSFKRLPRDSRSEPFIFMKCRSFSSLSPQNHEHCDSEDEEGPGRGAFWTVEPRERSSLLDAVKRNPWNFSNMSNSNTPVDNVLHSNSSTSLFATKRFGLTRSAPSHVLHSEGFGQSNQLNQVAERRVGQIRIYYTVDGRLIAACENQNYLDEQTDATESSHLLPDSRYWSTYGDTSSTEGATAEVEWPAEEEEKYLNILRLLNESEVITVDDTKASNSVTQLNGGLSESKAEYNEDMKSVTKQRRKSRLQPTRIRKCNECKENASGCESCQAKRHLLMDVHMQNPLKDYSLIDVANTLDSDQEHGPAGGPVVKSMNPRTKIETNKPSLNTIVNDESNNGKSIDENDSSSETDEVYVTPAPYVDHEYSHCQAQLRHPDESELVDRYNENYRIQRIKSVMQFHPLFKSFSDAKLLDMGADTTYRINNGLNYLDNADEFSSDDNDEYDDYYRKKHMSGDSNCDDMNYKSRYRTNYRNQYGAAKGASMRAPRRGYGRRRRRTKREMAPFNLNATRRSKRVIRAPRRPYDDFENVYSPDDIVDDDYYSDDGNDSLMQNKGKQISRSSFCTAFSDSNESIEDEDIESDTSFSKYPLHKRCNPREPVDYETFTDGSTDEEERYLRNASKIQQFCVETNMKDKLINCKRKKRGSSSSVNMVNVWNTLNWSLEQKKGAKRSMNNEHALKPYSDNEETYSEVKCTKENIQECEEEVTNENICKTGEHTTMEAAHLLLGISQMRSFREQSGYLSLDSSGDSSTLLASHTSNLEQISVLNSPTSSKLSNSTVKV